MSVFTDIERSYADVKDEIERFQPKITAGLARAKALEGNPAADALLLALHVPPEALTIAVDVINGLAKLYAAPPKPAVAGAAESDSPVIDDQGGAVVPDALSPSLSGGPVVGGAAF